MAISHNTTIMPSTETHRDLKWYKITAERVGNIGRLNVRLVKPVYVGKATIVTFVTEYLSRGVVLLWVA